MCGIVGYIATDNEQYEKARRGFFKYALMLDTLRGQDSTGVITIDKKFSVKRYKTLSPGFTFAPSKQFEKQIPNGWCCIGHNRAATVGKVNISNAHPFRIGDISLVHNGTLINYGRSLLTYDHKLDVDSQQIVLSLNEATPEGAREVLESIHGDFAIVWVDERDKSINMARNNARPLHLSFNYDRTLMLFMSDGDHLEIIAQALRNSGAYTPSIYQLDAFQWLKWKKGSLKPEVTIFSPFLVAQNNHPKTNIGITSSTQADRTAMERANERWDAMEQMAKNTNTGTSKHENTGAGKPLGDKFRINDNYLINHVVPKNITPAHVYALYKFFKVTPDELVAFTPVDIHELGYVGMYGKSISHVIGTADIWNGGEWEGTINFVPTRVAEIHKDKTWLVRPIGVTRNWSVEGCPGLLLDLLDTDYTPPKKEVASKLVADPDGRLIMSDQLQPKIENGCIDCQEELYMNQVHTYEYVNEGRDLICETCKWKSQFLD